MKGILLKHRVMECALADPKVVLKAFAVPKKLGDMRFVCDGRKLNAMMVPPDYASPGYHVIDRRFRREKLVS